jgi:signal transduction histidine kinase
MSSLPRQRDQLLQRIRGARRHVKDLADLVGTLLDVSAATSSVPITVSLDRAPTDLAALVRETAANFEEAAHAAACELRVKTPPGPVIGQWDGLRIEQVLAKLLANAAKYGRGQPIDVTLEATAATARVLVHDRGIGIAPADAARIFERYEQAVAPKNYGGLGLGLFVAHTIVEAHAGRLTVESTPGHGATFILELPRAAPAEVAAK